MELYLETHMTMSVPSEKCAQHEQMKSEKNGTNRKESDSEKDRGRKRKMGLKQSMWRLLGA